MKKSDLLKSIAEKGYDVGFGAKKHFATYDIIEKAPGLIGFSSMAFGIFSLVIKGLSTEQTSATFIVLGVIGLYISLYDHKKAAYEQSGVALTKIYNELKSLYFKAKSLDEGADFSDLQEEFSEIEGRYYSECLSKQILFSNWYAHYKFYWEHQIDWVNEQLKFNFFRDKVPLSLWLTIIIIVIGLVTSISDIGTFICQL
ncbi:MULTISPECIES: SLATT domain-containing protein [Vibrio]|uniref:SLATT domain-containing protein n=1 Tax=Vibrio TaxID=662 RepID=UPI001BD342C1|nr:MULTISPECIES: SLATT domain-containing protein [Vibrio]MBT0091876.1 SLATT domain-containing protein [Vibrio alginolyticus]MCA6721445.1 SLATT domain-containing protein [Vibrio alginolyticus]MDW1731551.1 SLATT domain-containing protein [Vibrio sp. Vb2356]MDW2260065.1 SLATT domain-containing protein [Vibrio sp. 1409]